VACTGLTFSDNCHAVSASAFAAPTPSARPADSASAALTSLSLQVYINVRIHACLLGHESYDSSAASVANSGKAVLDLDHVPQAWQLGLVLPRQSEQTKSSASSYGLFKNSTGSHLETK
jgi:hypothetical protein